MTDRPIIFSAPMIKALLAGTKTQTRRLLKPGKCYNTNLLLPDGAVRSANQPYAPGDRLYVREAWRPTYAAEGWREDLGRVAKPSDFDPAATAIEYLADGTFDLNGKDRPAIHMPRWASRLTLTVTEVRVQRLQDISEADAVAEGAEIAPRCPGIDGGIMVRTESPYVYATPGNWYRNLWDMLHGPEAWDANPWVVAISFTVAKGNIDALTNAEGGVG